MPSLRGKIIASYALTNLAVLIVVAIAYMDLNFLRTRIAEDESVHELLDAARTLHFDKKKLFVNGHRDAYWRLKSQIENTQSTLNRVKPYLLDVVEEHELSGFQLLIYSYRTLLDDLPELSGSDREEAQRELMALGEDMIRLSREYNSRHRELLGQATVTAMKVLAAALLLVLVMGVISALLVIRRVIRPISELERQLDAVPEGRERKLTIDAVDIEIQSFVQHFNAMLDRLRSQQSQLRHHEKAAALGVLVSGVAHELNNPLSNISTSVQLLLEEGDGTDADLRQQWLTHVDSETERARRIVRRLLDSVRHPTLNIQTYSASGVVRASVLLIHRQIDPGILLHIEDVTNACIEVDLERMQQVFINLIRNAVTAGARNIWVTGEVTTWEDSGPEDIERVQCEVESVSRRDQLLLFRVEDDGPGIPEEHLPQLFTPFFTTQSGGEGTGLGLYLVEEIVNEHHGCITVENRAGGGTRFLIWLPVSEEACEP